MDEKVAVKNTSDEQQVKAAGLKDRDRRRRELEDLAVVLSTQNGRRFCWRYLGKCGNYHTSFDAGNPHITSFNEGARNIGLQLMVDLEEADPEAFLKMIEEGRKDENP